MFVEWLKNRIYYESLLIPAALNLTSNLTSNLSSLRKKEGEGVVIRLLSLEPSIS